MEFPSERRITAVLGPTNTGKTYLAIERMLGHRSGMIGFPLRLLARENYDRIVRLKGRGAVALVTGEEKIVPPNPAYFVCTVESMPLDRRVAFLAVDEIQLAADPERGHIFTDRLLRARGTEETMFLGSDTIRPLIRKLVPEAAFLSRPRFSTLSYAGPKKLTRLPPRSAVVAFSAADVYQIAEVMRRQRGGTAVVMGALSPRTRNAQVDMYQSGEVDYLVATDAIGMGLNMDLDHVAFARLTKFDGRAPRRLTPAELAQIAGRAGRHMSDGSFGTLAEVGPLEPEIVDAVENHRFDPLTALHWRNPDLEFRSLGLLLRCLERRPPAGGLIRVRDADDHLALAALARDEEIARLAGNPAALRLLWEVCQIPDFRKVLSDAHTRLLGQIFRYLAGPPAGQSEGRLPEDWVGRQIARIDRTDGDIDTLVARIAHIRTWTYISHRGDWLADPVHWQDRARAIEDRLSDALHHSLTQRFVDRRHAVLVRRMAGGGRLLSAVDQDGTVIVEGHPVGRLDGFCFVPDSVVGGEEARPLLASARRALVQEIPTRVRRLEGEEDGAFDLRADGTATWHGTPVARLAAGAGPLTPAIEPLPSDFLEGALRDRVRRRLTLWLEAWLRQKLRPLWRARDAALSGPARGLVFQLVEALGLLPRRIVAPQLAALTTEDRQTLARLGVRIGAESIWFPGLMKGRPLTLRALLWAAHRGHSPAAPPAGRPLSLVPDPALPADLYPILGYRLFGGTAVRVDALERLTKATRKLSRQGPFAASEPLRALAGCPQDALPAILLALGYQQRTEEGGDDRFVARPRRQKARKRAAAPASKSDHRGRSARKRDGDSPFSALRDLQFSK
ncbi:helicase-related protein [Rhodospirillaceae bacterium SYSU D60014]|uniref:helicase-related protein n=1 Tax=Virgifigura deserti TaxID=2268457 RepID=UPI000E67642D